MKKCSSIRAIVFGRQKFNIENTKDFFKITSGESNLDYLALLECDLAKDVKPDYNNLAYISKIFVQSFSFLKGTNKDIENLLSQGYVIVRQNKDSAFWLEKPVDN